MTEHAAQPTDHSGRAVGGGRYQLQSLLGTGGMASVHLAHDAVLDRQVAVKTMHGELGREESFRERFTREAQSVAKLTHTNVVSVFDTGEDLIDGQPVPFIVMEYVDGQPLRNALDEAVAQQGAMAADRALAIVADVLAALDISHEMGLVHRDIKPGNVMLSTRDVIKVMDFGIARAMQSGVTSMTQTGMVVGTPQYLSPEQALGRGVDARSDLYSVGVLAFELLTGRLPFDADSPLAIAYAHVQEEPPAPSSINASLPSAVDTLVAQMLRKNPAERFANAQDLRAECLRVAAELTSAIPHITASSPAVAGAAVANSVFPEFGGPQSPPASPYAPGTPAAHGTAAPASYGYPPPQHAGPYAAAQQTTTPYFAAAGETSSPNGGRGSRSNRMLLLALAGLVTVGLIGGLAFAIYSGDDGTEATDNPGEVTETDDPGGEETPDPDEPRYNPGDQDATINATRCSHPSESFHYEAEPGQVSMPDFYGTHVTSAKECLRAGRAAHESEEAWDYANDEEVDETALGDGMVVAQEPKAGSPIDPEDVLITLTVSTGHEPR